MRVRPARLLALLVPLLACGSSEEPFTIESVTPAEIVSALGDTITITGVGLDQAQIGVLRLGDHEVALTEFKVESPTRITARLSEGIATGEWALELSGRAPLPARRESAIRVIEGELQIDVANIGQGDGGYIRGPGGAVLVIDGGRGLASNGSDSLAPILAARSIKPDLMLVTHLDADHLGGLVDFLRGPDEKICTSDDRPPRLGLVDYARSLSTCNSKLCLDYYALRDCLGPKTASGPGWLVPAPGAILPLGPGVKIRVVSINGELESGVVPTGSDNSNSIALLIEYGRFRYLTAGDLTGGQQPGCNVGPDSADVETPVAERVGKVDVLHVDHHGSCTSTNEAFLTHLSPTVALISVGENNSYGHPAPTVLERLGAAGARIYLTNPGITAAGPFPKTVLPATAERKFGHLRVRTADGRRYSVEVLDGVGTVLSTKSFEVPAR